MMMRKMTILLALVLVSGCGSYEEAPAPSVSAEEARAEVDGWLSAHARAEATKTHATGEHPVAQAEMARRELALRDMKQRDAATVKEVFSSFHAALDREKEEITQRKNRLQVVGRTLTPEERKYIAETAPRLLDGIKVREGAFHALLKALK